MMSLEIPADLRSLRVIGPWIRSVLEYSGEAEVDAAIQRLELAIQEVCVNIVEHAYGGEGNERLTVDYSLQGENHSFIVRDNGRCFDPATRPEVDLAHPTEGGYGLFIADSLCDGFDYTRCENENQWTLILRRTAQVSS